MSYRDIRKMRRAVDAIIKKLNKNIQHDDCWKGRFYARQSGGRIVPFEDKSGYTFYATVDLVDKKTGHFKKIFIEYFSYKSAFLTEQNLWEEMNNFILWKTKEKEIIA